MYSAEIDRIAGTLHHLFDRAPAMVVLLAGPEHRYAYANEAYKALLGREVIGYTVAEIAPELAAQGHVGLLDQVFQTGVPFRAEGMRTRVAKSAGESEDRYVDFVYQPVYGDQDRIVGVFAQGNDVTERVQAQAALAESQATLELATRAAAIGVWDWRADANTWTLSPTARRIWGFPERSPITQEMLAAAMHPDDLDETSARTRRALDPKIRDTTPYEYRIIRPDGEVRWVRAHAQAIFEREPDELTAVRYVGTMQDLTDQKAAEERLLLLAREVDHRANNLLAVAQSAIAMTKAPDLESYRRALLGRIGALARAHKLLAASRWEGASIQQLVREELAAFAPTNAERVTCHGPEVELSPVVAQGLAMVLHELATNAVKHGAFAQEAGVLAVNWECSGDGRVDLTWMERVSNALKKPERNGLGLRLIARALEGSAGGKTELIWDEAGLIARLSFPP